MTDHRVTPSAVEQRPVPSSLRNRSTVGALLVRALLSWRMLPLVALLAVPVGWTLSKDAIYAHPLSTFGTAMSSPLSVVLPLIPAALSLISVSRELQDRFAVNLRLRQGARRWVLSAAGAAAALSFLYFFAYAAASFIAIVYVLAPNGAFLLDPVGSPPPEQFVRFSELWAVSPAAYGLVYAAWCGLNGAVWTVVGLMALLLVRNRLLGLALPMAAVLTLSVATQLVGLDPLAPYILWIMFGYVQAPAWTALAPMTALIALVTAGFVVLLVRVDRLPALQ